jgi:50S ribosomal protein L16 3-hydroxylase
MNVLGNLSPAAFLRDYWHRRPLLIRQAFPGFDGILDRDELLALATRGDAISRLVIEHPKRRARWERHDGPFAGLAADQLPASHWTMLVHGVESLVPGGWELLRAFSFIPTARIDDLMISYAATGGSVGPHDDQYDVFLLQGPGRRRWQIAADGDRERDPDAAIKVLRSFVPEQEWVLEPGDMLYLPPSVAHWGVALEPCFTYSIGFLAPSHLDLVQSFLGWLGHALAGSVGGTLIGSEGVRLPKKPLALEESMIDEVAGVLGAVKWDRGMVEDFLGCFLTRPKPQAHFAVPERPLDEEAFALRLRGRGRLALALPTRGLVRGGRLYCNGEVHRVSRATLDLFTRLVEARVLPLPLDAAGPARALLHDWYAAGYVEFSR